MRTSLRQSVTWRVAFQLTGASLAVAATIHAATGIPEPPLVLYGQAFSKSDNSFVTITSANWTVSDGQGNNVSLNSASTPPTQIIAVNGVSYYLARVPFDTRQVGATTLTAPANSLPLQTTSPTYTRTATINGKPATFAVGTQAAFTYASADLGRVEQVDLFISTTGQPDDGYLDWARRYFGNASDPRAASNADPDGDGIPNAQEFAAGTDPLDAKSALRMLGFVPGTGGNITFSWSSVPGKMYVIEKSADLKTWTASGQPVPATGPVTSFTDNVTGAGARLFYRVRTSP